MSNIFNYIRHMFSFNERERFETVESSLYIVPSWKLTDPLFLKVLLKMMIFPISSHFHPYLRKSSNFTHILSDGLVQPPTSYSFSFFNDAFSSVVECSCESFLTSMVSLEGDDVISIRIISTSNFGPPLPSRTVQARDGEFLQSFRSQKGIFPDFPPLQKG